MDEFGFTPLCIASQKGHHELVNLLIKKGATVDYVCKVRFNKLYINVCLLHSDCSIL